MRRFFLAVIVVALTGISERAAAQHPKEIPAGTEVSVEEVAGKRAESYFGIYPIDEAVFRRMEGRSYKKECTVARDELRYLRVLHYDLNGRIRIGEMVCHRKIAADLAAIFRTLYQAHYPIERMLLIDEYDADDERSMAANNSSAFNFRFVSGTTRLSNHSHGTAVDINPLYNPYVYRRNQKLTVEPAAAKAYADRTAEFACKIDTADLCYKEFTRHGFEWGGNWKTVKDYQHFEKK